MPVIEIKMWEGRDKEMKRELIKAVTKATADTLGITEDRIEMIIHEISKDNWGKHGEQASEIAS